jgi:hypothetical protein
MKAYGGVNVSIHIFLTSALAGGDWSVSRPGRFTPKETPPRTHWIRGWAGSRAGVDDMEERKFLILPGLHKVTCLVRVRIDRVNGICAKLHLHVNVPLQQTVRVSL